MAAYRFTGPDRRQAMALAGTGLAAMMLPAPTLASAAAAPEPPPPSGPKKRIAVAKFEVQAKFAQALGGADVTMTLKEQSLVPKSAAQGEAADNPADLLGAQVIVRASVTTFDQTTGGGLSLGMGSSALTGLLGQKSSRGVIGIDIRLVDTTTGRIIASTHVQETANNSSLSIGLSKGSNTISQDSFANTPLGEATERAFKKAAPFIAAKLNAIAWTGRIADVADGEAFLNVGQAQGVKVGDTFVISRIGRRIVDPGSGEVLGVTEAPVGAVIVTEVNERFSKVAPAKDPLELRRGDIARYVRG